jgi:hypothetical protein
MQEAIGLKGGYPYQRAFVWTGKMDSAGKLAGDSGFQEEPPGPCTAQATASRANGSSHLAASPAHANYIHRRGGDLTVAVDEAGTVRHILRGQ